MNQKGMQSPKNMLVSFNGVAKAWEAIIFRLIKRFCHEHSCQSKDERAECPPQRWGLSPMPAGFWGVVSLAVSVVGLPAQGTVGETGKTNQTAAARQPAMLSNETRLILAGDKLSYRISEDREAARILVVSSSGEIEVPYLGRVPVAGRAVGQAEKEIKVLLERELYYQATVALSLEAAAQKPSIDSRIKSKQVLVVGQVRMQGVQEIPGGERYTVSRAVRKAGGLTALANGRIVQIARKVDGRTEKITTDVLAILQEGKFENDLELQDDDMVIVPEKVAHF